MIEDYDLQKDIILESYLLSRKQKIYLTLKKGLVMEIVNNTGGRIKERKSLITEQECKKKK